MMIRIAAVALASTTIFGCAKDISPHTYSVGSVGQVNRTVAATIVSAREVDIAGTAGTGATAGTMAGAVAGSAIGGNARGNIVGAIGGAVVGGIAGAAAEAGATRQKGIEYVVETSNGNLMTIIQGTSPYFSQGQKVFVLYGSPSRIIEDQRVRLAVEAQK